MRRFLFAVFLVVACATGAAADSYDDAVSALMRDDYALAARLFRPLAEKGHAGAQSFLGILYAHGEGVPQDYQVAEQWYRRAAEQGDAAAQFQLGVLYARGQGVPQNYQVAGQWYRKAAEQGHARAQYNLGVMYAQGQSVPQDFIRAYMWSNLAAAASSGDDGKNAMKTRDIVASQMTAAQIGKAQEMARRCQETKFKECD